MSIQEGLRNSLLIYKKLYSLSISEFAKLLGISRSALQAYLSGRANPRADTIDQIAHRLGIAPAVLVSEEWRPDQNDAILALFNSLQCLSALPRDKQLRLTELFCEAVELMTPESKKIAV